MEKRKAWDMTLSASFFLNLDTKKSKKEYFKQYSTSWYYKTISRFIGAGLIKSEKIGRDSVYTYTDKGFKLRTYLEEFNSFILEKGLR